MNSQAVQISLFSYPGLKNHILNFPTKDHWRSPAKLAYIEQGLRFFAANYHKIGIVSIAFPKLGTGLGNLSWNNVGPLMVRYLAPLDCAITIYIEDGDLTYSAIG